jgi:hypothetical protein
MKIQPRMSINIKNTQSNLKVFIYFKKVDTIIYWNKGLSYVRDLIYSSALVIDSTQKRLCSSLNLKIVECK